MENKKTNPYPSDYHQVQGNDTPEINRREFLKRAGKFAAYTPPTLMLLMQPSYAKIAKSGGYQESENFRGILQQINKDFAKSDEPYQNFFQSLVAWLRDLFRPYTS